MGFVVTWVTWVRGLRGLRGLRGSKYFLRGSKYFLRESTFYMGHNFYVGCVGQNFMRRSLRESKIFA